MVEHYIGGEWISSARTFETISPIDEQVIDEVARADAADVDRAVRAAHDAFPAWAALGPAGRAEHLHALADLIERTSSGSPRSSAATWRCCCARCARGSSGAAR